MYTILIKNWVKYNGRSDVKSCSWYRQSNDFFSDPDFYKVDSLVRILWIFILCAASRKNDDGRVKINLNVFCDAVKATPGEAKKALNQLKIIGCLDIYNDNELSTSSDDTYSRTCAVVQKNVTSLQTDERTDGQTNMGSNLNPVASSLDAVLNDWNEAAIASKLKPCPMAVGGNVLAAVARIKPMLEANNMTWRDYFSILARSDFLKTKKGGPVTILWALNEDNFSKAITGAFDNTEDPLATFFKESGITGINSKDA